MRFASFSAKDDKRINEFLQRNEKWMGSNGAYVFENAVHFMWNEISDEEGKRNSIVDKMKEAIVMQETQVALQTVDVDHLRDEAKHSGKGEHKVVEAESMLNTMKRKLEATKKVMASVMTGEYPL